MVKEQSPSPMRKSIVHGNSTTATGHFISTRHRWLVLGWAAAGGGGGGGVGAVRVTVSRWVSGQRLVHWQRWAELLLTEPEAKQAPTLSPANIIHYRLDRPTTRPPACLALQVGDIAIDTCARSVCCSSSCFKLCNASAWPQRAFKLYNGPLPSHPPPGAGHLCPQPWACLWAT